MPFILLQCVSVDVWCGLGNYTGAALSLDHPISRSDNADYRLIKSRLACTGLHCPFCIFCISPFVYFYNSDKFPSSSRSWCIIGLQCKIIEVGVMIWYDMIRCNVWCYWGGEGGQNQLQVSACRAMVAAMQNKATEKVIKRPAAAEAEPKMHHCALLCQPSTAFFSAW